MKSEYEKMFEQWKKEKDEDYKMAMKKTNIVKAKAKPTWDFDDEEDEALYRKESEAFGWDDETFNEYDEMVESLQNGDVQIMDSNGNRMTDIDDLLASLGYDGNRRPPAGRVRKAPKPSPADFETFTKEAVRALVEAGLADFVLLKNDKLRAWWQHVLAEELREQARLEELARLAKVKEDALSKLSDEEKAVLGLNKKR